MNTELAQAPAVNGVVSALPLSKFHLPGLDHDLHKFVDWDGPFGPMLDHPLLRVVSLEAEYKFSAGLAELNKQLAEMTALMESYKRTRKWSQFVFIFHRPYRVDALLYAVREAGASRLWPLIGDVWRDSESNMQSFYEWNEIWSHAYNDRGGFKKCHKRVMSAEDRRTFERLPEMITIYRGCSNVDQVEAYSWTTDETMAHWFAHRKCRTNEPVVAKMVVHKSFALAYFSDRQESEIVLDFTEAMDEFEFELIKVEPEKEAA